MAEFKPFANESAVLSLGGLTVENRLDRVTISGDIDLTRDRHGLGHARRLKALIDAAVATMESATDLPDELPPAPPSATRDPFA